MRIQVFSDQTDRGQRVEIIRPCLNCRNHGSLAISDGRWGIISHFDSESEIAQIISELRKEKGDGA